MRFRKIQFILKSYGSLKNLGMPSKERKVCGNIGLKADNSKDIVFDSKIVAQKCNAFVCNISAILVEKLPKRQF